VSGQLAGRVVLVTRPGSQGASLARLLRGLGAEAMEAPTIAVEGPDPGGDLDDAIRDAARGRFAWTVFTSGAGVRAWFERAEALGVGPPASAVAAVGEVTADSLRARDVRPSLVPAEFTTEALAAVFPEGAGRVLLARADLATADLEEALRAKGWDPARVDAYRVRLAEALPASVADALRDGRVDAVTFTSPSTVEGFVRLADGPRPPAVCIGPVTSEAARLAGFEVAAEAAPHTEEGLVDALVGALGHG